MKERIETRKDEIRLTTGDPKRMLGKFIVRRVLKKWNEDVFDKTTGDKATIERAQLLFEKGTYIDQDVLSSIKFYIEAGDIKEIEVSNQKRLAFPVQNSHLFPYKASVKYGDKKTTYLLYARSVANALVILTDYVELNSTGEFYVTDIKELDYCTVLVDNLKSASDRAYELDVAYLKNEISMEEFVSGTVEGIATGNSDANEDEEPGKKKFYQIKAHIVKSHKDEGEEETDGVFIVHTYTAARANILIEKWLRDKQEERYRESLQNPDNKFIKWEINSFIEESKIIPIGVFIPVQFSEAYASTESDT